jgi:hypothetical protein
VAPSRTSDSSRTAANESRDGTINGNEDFDNDTLPTKLEFNLTTDPFDEDTDGDRLLDPFEYEYDTLSPVNPDTDGDGIPDGQEVGEPVETRYGEYYSLNSDPTEVDSDDDGLSDAEELTESSQVTVATSPDAARQALNAESPDEIGGALTEYNVSTDPLAADTDEDGLDDGAERRNATHRTSADTDGDGISDSREIDIGTDPTLHDYQGPEIEVIRANFYKPALSFETTYYLLWSVSDASGVASTALVKGGTERFSTTSDGADGVSVSWRFSTGAGETLLDSFTGTSVTVTAEDVHGNLKETVGLERANFFGNLVGRLGSDTIFTSAIAANLGSLSGFSASLGAVATNVIDLIQQVLDDPLFFVDTIQQLLALVNELSPQLVERIVNAAIDSFQSKMERNNPYAQGAALYDEFRASWYAGYAMGFVAKALVGASAAKAIKSTRTVQRISDSIRSTRVGSVLTKIDDLGDAAKTRVATTTSKTERTGLVRARRSSRSPLTPRARTTPARRAARRPALPRWSPPARPAARSRPRGLRASAGRRDTSGRPLRVRGSRTRGVASRGRCPAPCCTGGTRRSGPHRPRVCRGPGAGAGSGRPGDSRWSGRRRRARGGRRRRWCRRSAWVGVRACPDMPASRSCPFVGLVSA